MKRIKKVFFIASISLVLFSALSIKAATVGEFVNFIIDKNFDSSARSQVQAILVKTTPSLYFYVEKNWWDLQVPAKQNEILADLDDTSIEFTNRIYPTLTSVFGSEWIPGVDGDNRITLLFQSMKEGIGGYFRSSDEYVKLQVPNSNEREMLYMSLAHIDNKNLKTFIAHEFVHLITFNQKDRIQGVQEEVWLNEARADLASTILGYDTAYDGSNLQKRVRDFLQNPTDSLPEWQENRYDYAAVNVFMHYLVDHYGISILADSLKLKSVGIASINAVLEKQESQEDFAQIFNNWTIATIVNDCTENIKYCYLNENLKDLRINPTLNFLPLSGSSSLSVSDVTKNWAGNWQKFIGGNGDLHLEFSSLAGLHFQVPYIIFNKDGRYSIKFLLLDENEKGQIDIKDFGNTYASLVIIPLLETKTADFDGLELTYPYTFTVSIANPIIDDDTAVIQKLLAQIESLKKQIAALQSGNNANTCVALNNNLSIGMKNNNEIRCLQQFLKSQGKGIYPEGYVTGMFGALTKMAVIRFQKQYNIYQSGFVGTITRAKINQLLGT